MREVSEWESYINRMTIAEGLPWTSYDHLAELAVSSYGLDKKSNKMALKDNCRYFFRWWNDNKSKFKKYNSLSSIGKLAGGKDHSTVLVAIKSKDSYNYDKNVACLKDFLGE